MDYVQKAERYEAGGKWDDWLRASEMWWRAAMSLNGNPRNLRTYYHQREDAAKARGTAALAQAV